MYTALYRYSTAWPPSLRSKCKQRYTAQFRVYIYMHIELYTCTCIHAAYYTYKTFRAVVEYKIPEEEKRRETEGEK
jgi:hypothetical protein